MTEWFSNMPALERGFTLCATIGALLFVIRMALQLLGGDDGGDASDAGDTDASFQFFSLHGMTVFLLMFGLIGRALLIDSRVSEGWALFGATVGGLVSFWGIAQVYLLMMRLQSSGTIDMKNAIGRTGTVYLSIPPGRTGKVELTIQNRLRVEDAVSEEQDVLATGDPIEVVALTGSNTLVVKRLGPHAPATEIDEPRSNNS